MAMTYAILDYKGGEYAVAHLGTAKVAGSEHFSLAWVVDVICPTMKLAVEAQLQLAQTAMMREKMEAADRKALERRR